MAALCFFSEKLENGGCRHTSSKTMQEFHANFTSQANILNKSSLTQSFYHGANITKQLFCFQLACKVRPKKSNKSPSSSFCQQPQPSSQQAGI